MAEKSKIHSVSRKWEKALKKQANKKERQLAKDKTRYIKW